MRTDCVPVQAFGFFVEEMDGENILYRIGTHTAIHLNDTATIIWKLADGSRTVQEIVDVLKNEYPAESEVATDVVQAIESLLREGALLAKP